MKNFALTLLPTPPPLTWRACETLHINFENVSKHDMKTCQEYLFTCSTNLDAHSRNHNKFTEVVVYIYFVTWMVSKGESKTASPGVGLQVSGRAACGIILIKRVDAILEDVSVAEIIV